MQKKATIEKHLRFAVLATDVALFSIRDGELVVRLIRVHRPPHFPESRGLPGGLIDVKETADEAVRRLVRDKASIGAHKLHIEQLYTFSRIDRDPRGRVVAVAYVAFVPWETLSEDEQSDTEDAWWSAVHAAKRLAYDHDEMLAAAVSRLRSRIAQTTILSRLMPREFTLTDLESIYERILGRELDKRNFRKKILKLDILEEVKGKKSVGRFRPAQLYRFASNAVKDIGIL